MKLDILNQADVWVDRNEIEHRIDQMSGRYALNVYNYLKRKAKEVGFHYGLYLCQVGADGHDDVMREIDREQERISDDPVAWLLNKPLMLALMARVAVDRIENGTVGYDYAPDAERRGATFTPYVCEHDFEVAPREVVSGQSKPGDDTKVFVVLAGEYEDRAIQAVFVGNRLAALKYEAEYNRYEDWAKAYVQEWEDNHIFGTGATYREYREPWTRVTFRTVVDLETGDVVSDERPKTEVITTNVGPEPYITKETVGFRGRYKVAISTSGSDHLLDQVRTKHTEYVNKIRANVLADIPRT